MLWKFDVTSKLDTLIANKIDVAWNALHGIYGKMAVYKVY